MGLERGRGVVTMAYKRYNTIANAGTRICGNILVGARYKGLLEDGFRATTVRNVGVAQH